MTEATTTEETETVTDKITGESTVSRIMQLKIPAPVSKIIQEVQQSLEPEGFESGFSVGTSVNATAEVNALDPDGTGFYYITNQNLTQADTVDQKIIDARTVFFAPTAVLSASQADDGTWTLLSSLYSIEISEPLPTSQFGEYDKIKVLIDREEHLFFFDWTENNRRSFFGHPSGSYWTISNDGTYTLKTKKIVDPDDEDIKVGGNYQLFIDANKEETVKGDIKRIAVGTRRTSIFGDDYLNIRGSHGASYGANRTIDIKGNDISQVGVDKITIIGRNRIENVTGYKEQNVKGNYVIKSSDAVLIDAPSIEFRTNNIKTTNRGSLKEETGGARKISASALSLASTDNMGIAAGRNLDMTIVGSSKEIVSGLGFAGITAKEIRVILGNLVLSVLLGEIDINNGKSGLNLSALGIIDLAGPLGSLNIDIAGIAILEGTQVKLGENATEPVMKGNALLDWIINHTHKGPNGETATPSQSSTLHQSLSTKVLVE